MHQLIFNDSNVCENWNLPNVAQHRFPCSITFCSDNVSMIIGHFSDERSGISHTRSDSRMHSQRIDANIDQFHGTLFLPTKSTFLVCLFHNTELSSSVVSSLFGPEIGRGKGYPDTGSELALVSI